MEEAKHTRHRSLWLTWLLLSSALLGWMSYTMLEGKDQSLFMPGPLTPGHRQLELACDTCHSDPLGNGEVLQQSCVDCHGEDRKKPFDSHPASKFKDPRNADRLENINALSCISCHTEHRPDMTLDNGLTQPRDFCFHCHSDIGEERPSHQGMAFDTCKNSGCHNFHNNRALYTDFLVKHLHEPATLENPRLPEREFAQVLEEIIEYPRDRYPVQALETGDIDAPEDSLDESIESDWLASTHAQAGVNCSACHLLVDEETEQAEWNDHPDQRGCRQCHDVEIVRFAKGKHGMRIAAGLTAMTPSDALLPMKKDAVHEELGCNSCHPAHRFQTRPAAVDACLGCHDDRHSLAYKDSPHFELWQKEISGESPPGSGVSCASCHMPRVSYDVSDWLSRIIVDHNQNATLSPNSKMIRPACLHCHGLEFSIDALADKDLIERNFIGRPSLHVESMDLAERDHQRALEETAGLEDN